MKSSLAAIGLALSTAALKRKRPIKIPIHTLKQQAMLLGLIETTGMNNSDAISMVEQSLQNASKGTVFTLKDIISLNDNPQFWIDPNGVISETKSEGRSHGFRVIDKKIYPKYLSLILASLLISKRITLKNIPHIEFQYLDPI